MDRGVPVVVQQSGPGNQYQSIVNACFRLGCMFPPWWFMFNERHWDVTVLSKWTLWETTGSCLSHANFRKLWRHGMIRLQKFKLCILSLCRARIAFVAIYIYRTSHHMKPLPLGKCETLRNYTMRKFGGKGFQEWLEHASAPHNHAWYSGIRAALLFLWCFLLYLELSQCQRSCNTQVLADLQPWFASLAFADGHWHLWGLGYRTGGFLFWRPKQEDSTAWGDGGRLGGYKYWFGVGIQVNLDKLPTKTTGFLILLKSCWCDTDACHQHDKRTDHVNKLYPLVAIVAEGTCAVLRGLLANAFAYHTLQSLSQTMSTLQEAFDSSQAAWNWRLGFGFLHCCCKPIEMMYNSRQNSKQFLAKGFHWSRNVGWPFRSRFATLAVRNPAALSWKQNRGSIYGIGWCWLRWPQGDEFGAVYPAIPNALFIQRACSGFDLLALASLFGTGMYSQTMSEIASSSFWHA